VNIILGVNEEVNGLSLVSSKSKSISDRFELFDVLNENESSQRYNVEIEGKNLKS